MNEQLTINPDWFQFLHAEFNAPYFQTIQLALQKATLNHTVYPPQHLLYNAFNLCPLQSLKVIILGQDPYHGHQQANGLCFSVNPGIPIPPSLKNIFKELIQDIPGFQMPNHGDLSAWAKQGVLLLNSVLSVEANQPGSHKHLQWQTFTDAVIQKLSSQHSNLVFILWGNYAIQKASLINQSNHLLLTAAHPSPLARGAFFGNKHFSKTNSYLKSHGKQAIQWQLSSIDLFNSAEKDS